MILEGLLLLLFSLDFGSLLFFFLEGNLPQSLLLPLDLSLFSGYGLLLFLEFGLLGDQVVLRLALLEG